MRSPNEESKNMTQKKKRKILLSLALNLRSTVQKLDSGQKISILPENHMHNVLRAALRQVEIDLGWVYKQSQRTRNCAPGTPLSRSRYKRTTNYRERLKNLALMKKYFELYPNPYDSSEAVRSLNITLGEDL